MSVPAAPGPVDLEPDPRTSPGRARAARSRRPSGKDRTTDLVRRCRRTHREHLPNGAPARPVSGPMLLDLGGQDLQAARNEAERPVGMVAGASAGQHLAVRLDIQQRQGPAQPRAHRVRQRGQARTHKGRTAGRTPPTGRRPPPRARPGGTRGQAWPPRWSSRRPARPDRRAVVHRRPRAPTTHRGNRPGRRHARVPPAPRRPRARSGASTRRRPPPRRGRRPRRGRSRGGSSAGRTPVGRAARRSLR